MSIEPIALLSLLKDDYDVNYGDELMEPFWIKQLFEKWLNDNPHLGRKKDIFFTEERGFLHTVVGRGFPLTQIRQEYITLATVRLESQRNRVSYVKFYGKKTSRLKNQKPPNTKSWPKNK